MKFLLLAATAVLAMVMMVATTFATAAVTDNSVLSCETADVLPGQNVSCLIYLRDELQEPTTTTSASIFSIRVLSDIAEAALVVSPVKITHDPTVVKFTVSSPIGTRLRIDAYVSDTGLPVRNTGAVVLVLDTPPAKFGDIVCDCGDKLSFRATTKCVVTATGVHGLPAHVTQSNFFLSEEHGDGSFKFLSGNRALEFTYTAPTFPSMTYSNFLFRLGLLSESSSVVMETSLSLAVVYPQKPATEYSRLRCGSDGLIIGGGGGDAGGGGSVIDSVERHQMAHRCFVSALDFLGPVAFDSSLFMVDVQRITPSGGVVSASSDVSWRWDQGGNAGVAVLTFEPVRDMLVFEAQINVRLASSPGKKAIRGSPGTMRFGTAPQPIDLQLVKCARSFSIAGGQVLCYVSVGKSATPDPYYVTAEAERGSITCKYNNNNTAATNRDRDLAGKNLIVLCYSAPSDVVVAAAAARSRAAGGEGSISGRIMDMITVKSGEVGIAGSPVEMAVYPQTAAKHENDTRISAIICSFLLFGSVLITGIYFNFQHASAKARAVERLTEHQKLAAEHMKIRPLFLTATNDHANAPMSRSATSEFKVSVADSSNNATTTEMKERTKAPSASPAAASS